MNYVGAGRRFVAALLDGVAMWVIRLVINAPLTAILYPNLVNQKGEANLSVLSGLWSTSALVGIIISVLYVVVLQHKLGGQTLGKRVMGIKVVDSKGKVPSMLTFFLRDIVGKTVSAIVLGIGYLMVLWDGKKQGLHDKIASTYVVKA